MKAPAVRTGEEAFAPDAPSPREADWTPHRFDRLTPTPTATARRPASRVAGAARLGAPLPILIGVLFGLAYEIGIVFAVGGTARRVPTPYAVPIFDTPFALVAVGVGYLCFERHRLRQDLRSVSLGITLWLTALLALAHILAQPDYPANPGVNAGIAPYFFLLSYLTGLAGIGLAGHFGERHYGLTDSAWLKIGGAVAALAGVIDVAVLQVRPLLPSLVMAPGKFTPFGLAAIGMVIATAGAWALWGGLRRYVARDPFAGYLLLAAYIWTAGLLGFMLYPFRYSIPWYLSGLARPLGVGVIFVGLLREQVSLYRDARARQRDLDVLHRAGQALARSLDLAQIARTIVSRALEVSGADAAILFRLDDREQVLKPLGHAGAISARLLELPFDNGAAAFAVAQQRPAVSGGGHDPAAIATFERVTDWPDEGPRSVMAIPLSRPTGATYGALSVLYRRQREFTATDVELLEAFGTQALAALENGRAFDQLAMKAHHDEALHDFSQRLLEATGEKAIRRDALQLARELLGADSVGLFVFDARVACLRLEAGLGWRSDPLGAVNITPSAESFTGYAFLHRAPASVEDLTRELHFTLPPALLAEGIRAGIATPLGVREQPIGVLAAYYRTPRRLGDEELSTLNRIAHLTALALEKVRLHSQLEAKVEELQRTQHQLIQADKLRALGTLLSGVAHELNNPLSTILATAAFLKVKPLPSEALQARLDIVARECQRAARIVRGLLGFARCTPPERCRVDLNEVLRATLSLQAPEFGLNGVRVVTALDPLPMIWADPTQLQQVLLNLFTNATHALKSTGRGDGVLAVSSAVHADGIVIVVEDNGPGIPSEHLGQVFDPFFTTKPIGEGTGLGLSVSIGIVEAHGGRMSVENVPTGGARFTLRLPVGEGVDDRATPVTPPTVARRVRVLVVDDEPALRDTVAQVLATLGHQVETAATGAEAIHALGHGSYDVVLLDLRLPDVDGAGVWQWIRTHRPRLAGRVIFMTGDTIRAGSQQFLDEAGRPVLEKPLAMDRITTAIEDLVRTNEATTLDGTARHTPPGADPDSAFDPALQALQG
jgi:signal transduction histidine kinase/ActR/RegA family two-component response regulator